MATPQSNVVAFGRAPTAMGTRKSTGKGHAEEVTIEIPIFIYFIPIEPISLLYLLHTLNVFGYLGKEYLGIVYVHSRVRYSILGRRGFANQLAAGHWLKETCQGSCPQWKQWIWIGTTPLATKVTHTFMKVADSSGDRGQPRSTPSS